MRVRPRDAGIAVLSSAAALGIQVLLDTPAAEIRAGAVPASVREIWILDTVSTTSSIGLGRPAAIGVTPTTSVPFQAGDPADTAPLASLVTAWGTLPTAPTAFLRRIITMATVGGGYVFEFEPGALVIPANGSLVLWNTAGNPAIEVSVTLEE